MDPAAHIDLSAKSMGKFRWTHPILAFGTGVIIAGKRRRRAAQRRGGTKVPVIDLFQLSPAAIVIGDNRIALQLG